MIRKGSIFIYAGVALSMLSVIIYGTSADGSAKLTIQLAYETLCPSCGDDFKNAIKPNYENFIDYVDFVLIPYGSTEETEVNNKITFSCQHGPDECIGNLYQACALNIVTDVKKKLAYCVCVMSAGGKKESFKSCAEDPTISVDYNAIDTCTTNDDGIKYLIACGKQQDAIEPPVTEVLAVAFDNKNTSDDEYKAFIANFNSYICAKLTGEKPQICSSCTPSTSSGPSGTPPTGETPTGTSPAGPSSETPPAMTPPEPSSPPPP